MKTLLYGLIGVALAASFSVTVPEPANAAPVFVPKAEQGRTDVQQARHTYRHYLWQQRRAERRAYRRYSRDRCRYYGDCYYGPRPYYGRSYFGPRRYYGRSYYGPRYHRYYRPGLSLRFDF